MEGPSRLLKGPRESEGLTPDQLKRWLRESEREYLVFSAADLVDALPWPAGVEALQQMCTAYAQHRRARGKTETLVADEIIDAIRCLTRDFDRLRGSR